MSQRVRLATWMLTLVLAYLAIEHQSWIAGIALFLIPYAAGFWEGYTEDKKSRKRT